ncbi:MAG: flagellin FliC [Nitrospina sp.]|nr:MAG: flagellin FliC [Nitrospina sp.]
MAISIFTNLTSLTAQRILSINTDRLSQSIERVASGLRINRASDDPSGLAVAETLRSDIRVLRQGLNNVNDGISLLNVAESALGGQVDLLIRLKELASQSASGTLTNAERANLQVEFDQLRAEITRLGTTTEFNGQLLLTGNLNNGGTTIVIQIGLDSSPNSRLDLSAAANLTPIAGTIFNATGLEINTLDISTAGGALAALTPLDDALANVNVARTATGAVQNRLLSIVSQQTILIENVVGAESQIRDADIAEEIALLVRNQILVEAAVAVLAQANLIPELVLQLLPSNNG